MKLKDFKLEAKELALGAGLQYQQTPEGDIYLTSENMKMWIAKRSDDEIEKVIDPEQDREWEPEMWLMVYRAKVRRDARGDGS